MNLDQTAHRSNLGPYCLQYRPKNALSRRACKISNKLEDLKVLRRSPDLFNNVKIGQGFTAYNITYCVLP